MRTASWTELDPDATYYGRHDSSDGWISSCNERLAFARTVYTAPPGGPRVVVAFIGGEHVRVPDGDPPVKPSSPELRILSDKAELRWLAGQDVSHDDTYNRYVIGRMAFLRARLAEGEKHGG